ncbi:MAG: riboflavin synthase [Planctomycetes bacterium]|nr:riboflavin synthase [Planctomycetota bacterium]
MFTGIVEAAVAVRSAERSDGLLRLKLDLSTLPDAASMKLGDSVAVNGCCLTVATLAGGVATFEAVPETQRLTNLGGLQTGSVVNVERALQAGARFDGHFVQGHVDGTGHVLALDEASGEVRVGIDCGAAFAQQCIHKGSVCIDGISLTIAELDVSSFTVAVIPHTRRVTNIRYWKPGSLVNLEADLIGKYVRRQLEATTPGSSITDELLRRTGFAP